jgi:1-acyl-sn-glycerol-3-phosphate acyltransferase
MGRVDAMTARGVTPATYSQRTLAYRSWQAAARLIMYTTARPTVVGTENYPTAGPYIVAINHLHMLDLPTIFAASPHRFGGLAAQHWADHRVAGPIIRSFAEVIPVDPRRVDHRAMARALRWLEGGGVLLVAPEGMRAPTGALLPGQPGMAYLALRSGVPIVPVVAYGQERLPSSLKRLRRTTIVVSVGEAVAVPRLGREASAEDVTELTEDVMLRLARMLPPEYRGVYADRVGG